MATKNQWRRTPSSEQAPTRGTEPAGKVRRSQLISTYGIGAIIDLEKGSFMPMGLDEWEASTRLPSLTIREARLEAQLEVGHFRLPPIAEEIRGSGGRVNPSFAIPALRFPAWHECPQCHRIGREGDPFQLATDGARLECIAHKKAVPTTPVRFVVACDRGHLEEFPWAWWAHRSRAEGICDRPTMELKSRGRSAALADLSVRCLTCNANYSLGDAFRPGGLGTAKCQGHRPWLQDRQEGCESPPRVIQRGASNAHFAVVASALSIPPMSDASFQIIESQWFTLGALPVEAMEPVLRRLSETFNVPIGALHAALREKQRIEGFEATAVGANSRGEEYAALQQDRDDPVLGGLVPHFENTVYNAPAEISAWFDLIGAVSRLREVRALAGLTRIEPYPVGGDRIMEAIRSGRIAPLSRTPGRWLPATEIRGEGIFLRFRGTAVDAWLAANSGAIRRARVLEQRSAAAAAERGVERDYEITATHLLVHSFAHALIRTISIECGYSSSALRERLYLGEDGAEPMHGLLVYTGSPDSEGSLGGLVRLAEPEHLQRIVLRTLRSSAWCGSDPVCIESDPRQSGDRVSGAACHCCLLVPETACEKFNRELDRTMLVGGADAQGSWQGFFGPPGD